MVPRTQGCKDGMFLGQS